MPAPLSYNRLAGQSVERLAALDPWFDGSGCAEFHGQRMTDGVLALRNDFVHRPLNAVRGQYANRRRLCWDPGSKKQNNSTDRDRACRKCTYFHRNLPSCDFKLGRPTGIVMHIHDMPAAVKSIEQITSWAPTTRAQRLPSR